MPLCRTALLGIFDMVKPALNIRKFSEVLLLVRVSGGAP